MSETTSAPPATPEPAPAHLRDKLAIALDVDDIVVARRLAREVQPYFGVAKVGLELYSAVGPSIVGHLIDAGFKVFLDIKLHDIPTTVSKAARVLGSIGASYLTIHAMGGAAMLRAGVDGLCEGASRAGLPEPVGLAVTILTSDDGAPPHILGKRVQAAVEGGCRGIVCASSDIRQAKTLAPRILAVVPGIRPAGMATHDQARAATPEAALAAGADLLVIGRAVTGAEDRAEAAARIVASLA
jgi:orotidine-5'-phosphate decarboxylase